MDKHRRIINTIGIGAALIGLGTVVRDIATGHYARGITLGVVFAVLLYALWILRD